jgi:hypothetical protein
MAMRRRANGFCRSRGSYSELLCSLFELLVLGRTIDNAPPSDLMGRGRCTTMEGGERSGLTGRGRGTLDEVGERERSCIQEGQ